MATVHQHQIESKVNDLYFKMQKHAQILMRLSVQFDNLKTENDNLKLTIINNRKAIKNILQNGNEDNNSSMDGSSNLNENYESFQENSGNHQENSGNHQEIFNNNVNDPQLNDIKLSSN